MEHSSKLVLKKWKIDKIEVPLTLLIVVSFTKTIRKLEGVIRQNKDHDNLRNYKSKAKLYDNVLC